MSPRARRRALAAALGALLPILAAPPAGGQILDISSGPRFFPPEAPAPGAPPPVHPHLLPELTAGTTFPRLTPQQLAASGYPDHMHWPTWEKEAPRLDAEGRPYGPFSMCRHRVSRPREGLKIQRGAITFGPFDLTYNPEYEPCDMLPFLEWAEVGLLRARDLLGLEAPGTLRIYNPDNFEHYVQLTGHGVHRDYRLEGDSLIVQPIPILTGRTLIGHTAAEVAVHWLLRENGGDRLPAWLAHGLPLYLADLGSHLNNFMDQYRVFGPVLLPVARADSVLAGPPAADPEIDRQLFRRARYVAFLMVWRLVEEDGGLEPLRRLLSAVAAGQEPDAAARQAYRTDLAGLAKRLDPSRRGEPVTWDDFLLQPHLAPER